MCNWYQQIGTPADVDRLQYHCTVQSCNLFKTSAQHCSLQLIHGNTKLFYTRTILYEHELQKTDVHLHL